MREREEKDREGVKAPATGEGLSFLQGIDWGKWAAVTVTVAGALVAIYLLFDVVFTVMLPFFIAFLLAALTHPLAKRVAARTRLPLGAVAVTLTLLALVLVGLLCYVAVSGAISELKRFLALAADENSELSMRFAQFFDTVRGLFQKLPQGLSRFFAFATDIVGDPQVFFKEQLARLVGRLGEALPTFVAALLRALPRLLFFLLITVIACFYFSIEYGKVTVFLGGLMPRRLRGRMPEVGRRLRAMLGKYAAAYGLLFLITFGELLLGLWLIGADYVLLPALFIAFLDLLPIFGVGAALIPWGIFALAVRNTALGVGLLVLYLVITVVRQIVEPHIVGKSLGLHPIPMLIGLYAGLSLFGIAGAIAGPLLLLAGKLIVTNLKSTKQP
ncbi:MAG: sporulation integral membrane protein YtvI [Clostridia bacterium]|nr:sporulation integral membrane protein YtvI [Clostridia bacterium]